MLLFGVESACCQSIPLPVLSLSDGCQKVVSSAPEEACEYLWWIHPQDSLVYAEGRVCNGLQEGWWSYDHLEGSCHRITGRFLEGKRTGLWQCFDAGGGVLVEGEFVSGKASGFWRLLGGDGGLKAEGWCSDGVKDGWWVEYLSDSSIQKGEYSGNQKVGVWEKRSGDRLLSVKDWGQ